MVAVWRDHSSFHCCRHLRWNSLQQKKTMDNTFAEVKKQTKAATESSTAAQNAVTQSRDQFREDRRPYIWLTKTGLGGPTFIPNLKDPKSGQVTWDWHWTNYGKTPALDIKYTQSIKVGERPYMKSHGSVESFGAPLPPEKDDFSTVVSDPGVTPIEFNDLMLVVTSEILSPSKCTFPTRILTAQTGMKRTFACSGLT